ncbi:hypothetical protein Rs2_11088 [Raphanus sativus]|nr:hypothetical protein Rs2_11078 [Raphanus sativus]KAJ4907425.1 hypothetical protein Rs2_11083 [Raphanus sativus]KAJ4907430.1 hypothetical protein Rs2_11088 [Raphanus sativus]
MRGPDRSYRCIVIHQLDRRLFYQLSTQTSLQREWRSSFHCRNRLGYGPSAISAPKVVDLSSNCRGSQAVIYPSSGDKPRNISRQEIAAATREEEFSLGSEMRRDDSLGFAKSLDPIAWSSIQMRGSETYCIWFPPETNSRILRLLLH